MVSLIYDESFEGFLTAVFEVYEYKYEDVQIVKQSTYNSTVFQKEHSVQTNEAKAKRVWTGLHQYLSKTAADALYHTWLSELRQVEQTLLQYIQYVFTAKVTVETDFSDPAVLRVTKIA